METGNSDNRRIVSICGDCGGMVTIILSDGMCFICEATINGLFVCSSVCIDTRGIVACNIVQDIWNSCIKVSWHHSRECMGHIGVWRFNHMGNLEQTWKFYKQDVTCVDLNHKYYPQVDVFGCKGRLIVCWIDVKQSCVCCECFSSGQTEQFSSFRDEITIWSVLFSRNSFCSDFGWYCFH